MWCSSFSGSQIRSQDSALWRWINPLSQEETWGFVTRESFCSILNAHDPLKVLYWNPAPSAVVLGSGAFEGVIKIEWDPEGGALMDESYTL